MAAASTINSVRAASTPASRVSGRWWWPVPTIFPNAPKTAGIRVGKRQNDYLYRLFQREPLDFPFGCVLADIKGKRFGFAHFPINTQREYSFRLIRWLYSRFLCCFSWHNLINYGGCFRFKIKIRLTLTCIICRKAI